MISLIIPIDNNSKNIESNLSNIFNQTNKNFALHILDASTSLEVKQIVNKFDFNTLKNVIYTKVNNISSLHLFYDDIIKNTQNKYIYFGNNNSIIPTEFVESISKAGASDVIICGNVKSNITIKKEELKKVESYITPILCDKIFSINFLKTNEIYFHNNDYMSIIFLYKTIAKCNSITVIKSSIKNMYQDLYMSLANFAQMYNELIVNYQESKFWKQNEELINELLIFYTFIYIYNIFLYDKKSIKRNITLTYIEKYLSKKNINWRKNKKLEYIDKILEKKLSKLIEEFDFSDDKAKKLNLYLK